MHDVHIYVCQSLSGESSVLYIANSLVSTGWKCELLVRTQYSARRRAVLFSLLPCIQLGNERPVEQLETERASPRSLHGLLLLLHRSIRVRLRHQPLILIPSCHGATQVVLPCLCSRLEWPPLGFTRRSALWMWQRIPVHGRPSCGLCCSRCSPGWCPPPKLFSLSLSLSLIYGQVL